MTPIAWSSIYKCWLGYPRKITHLIFRQPSKQSPSFLFSNKHSWCSYDGKSSKTITLAVFRPSKANAAMRILTIPRVKAIPPPARSLPPSTLLVLFESSRTWMGFLKRGNAAAIAAGLREGWVSLLRLYVVRRYIFKGEGESLLLGGRRVVRLSGWMNLLLLMLAM